jgi:hypothetical protein
MDVRKDTGPVAVVRRGVVGGAFFVFALVVMVMLVHSVDQASNGPDATLSSTGSPVSARPSGPLSRAGAAPATSAAPAPFPAGTAVPNGSGGFGDGTGAGAAEGPPPNDAAAPAVGTGVTLINFDGLPASLVVRDTVRVQLVVEGNTGPIRFVLRGATARTTVETLTTFQPFVFTPQAAGWDTTSVTNGVYTLTAETVNNSANPLSTQIDVDN